MYWLSLCCKALLLFLAASVAHAELPARYDLHIFKAARLYLPAVDWRLYKAQLWQESRLDPDAVSPVGARGLAQFMPATWDEVVRDLGLGQAGPHEAVAIDAGAYYMAKLRRIWGTPRPERDRHSLALASYNAGAGNLIKAQRLCGMAVRFDDIIRCLPQVTGRHAAETQHYVPAIYRHFERIRNGI